MVFAAGRIIHFKGGQYETEDKDEIAALKKAKNVTEVSEKKQK